VNLTEHDTGSFQHPDDPGEPTTGDPRLSITKLEGQMLAALVAGRRVLEIGTGLGVSTAAMAATAEHVATYDIDAWVHDTIWPGLPDNVVGVKSLEHVGRAFDAVFIDADHSTEAVARDLSVALQHLGLGGVVIAHDTASPAVRLGLGLATGWHWINTTHGLGVLWV
jgi:protein-L-isoaspartate O-methyltransferase